MDCTASLHSIHSYTQSSIKQLAVLHSMSIQCSHGAIRIPSHMHPPCSGFTWTDDARWHRSYPGLGRGQWLVQRPRRGSAPLPNCRLTSSSRLRAAKSSPASWPELPERPRCTSGLEAWRGPRANPSREAQEGRTGGRSSGDLPGLAALSACACAARRCWFCSLARQGQVKARAWRAPPVWGGDKTSRVRRPGPGRASAEQAAGWLAVVAMKAA